VTVQDPFETGLVGVLLARHLGVPLHVQVHTDPFDIHFKKHSFLNRLRVVIARFVLRRAARIRVVSGRIARSLTPLHLSAEISVLPIYTDVGFFRGVTRTKHPTHDVSLLYIGRLEKEKHADLAVRALAGVRAAGFDAGLTIVGEGSELPQLHALEQALNVADFVEHVGRVSDIRPFLSTATVVLVPSEYEGYGIVIIEALASGVPVISSDVGIAREAGALIAARDSFSAAVIEWLKNGRQTMTLLNYPYASWEEYVAAYVADLEACMKKA
jgi:glycosyltransferase involved in cell wall biosynthesis